MTKGSNTRSKHAKSDNRKSTGICIFYISSYSPSLASIYTDSYWDWAHNDQVPDVLKMATVELNVIKILDTDSTTIPNPLHSYTFPAGLVPEEVGSSLDMYPYCLTDR